MIVQYVVSMNILVKERSIVRHVPPVKKLTVIGTGVKIVHWENMVLRKMIAALEIIVVSVHMVKLLMSPAVYLEQKIHVV